MALLLPSPSLFLKFPYVFVRSSYGAGLFLSKTNTLLDKAALTYAEALEFEGQTAGVPQLETCTMPVSARNDSNMKMGWALKTSVPSKLCMRESCMQACMLHACHVHAVHA